MTWCIRGSVNASTQKVGELVDHLFRREAGRITSRLARVFGARRLDLVEDAVQFALLQALEHWAFAEIPDNPHAWLTRVASNRALDTIRAERNLRSIDADDESTLSEVEALSVGDAATEKKYPSEVSDDQLALMFVCCHPALPHPARVALTLKAVCGFGVTEIARAFLSNESSVAQRLVRAKRLIREQHIGFQIPAPEALPERLQSVLEVLYALFTEGYAPTCGEDLLNTDMCEEAIRLTTLLADNATTTSLQCHALLALMLFQSARAASRVDTAGELLLLERQPRESWNRPMIALGMLHLQRAGRGDRLTPFHIEAEIAVIHASAADAHSTTWPSILALYDQLLTMRSTPVVLIKRAIVLSQVQGPAAALTALEQVKPHASSERYPFLPMAQGEFLRALGRSDEAARCFEQTLLLARTEPERRFIRHKLNSLEHARERRSSCTS